VDLTGQKIDAKFREFASDFMELMEIEESRQKELEMKVTGLEERLEHTLAHVANLSSLLLSVQTQVGDLEDVVMEESDDNAYGEMVSSSLSLSTNVELVKNMVAIPVPAPSIIHHSLIPIKIPEEFIPPSLRSTPSPPYVQAWEDDPSHDGVLEYWVDPEIGL
jgi:hypothetical protein